MISAFLNGQLSSQQENMEDLLTSCVFDLLRYSGFNGLVIRWLAAARTIDGDLPLSLIRETADVEYDFWPQFKEDDCFACIPDLIIRINDGVEKYIVLIEAKYRSSKSSYADESRMESLDQLAKEWVNLTKSLLRTESRYSPFLIYLTPSARFPIEDLEASIDDIANDQFDARKRFTWLSWQHLYPIIEKEQMPSVVDLRKLLHRLDLRNFDGFSFASELIFPSWSFDHLVQPVWSKPISKFKVSWGFSGNDK